MIRSPGSGPRSWWSRKKQRKKRKKRKREQNDERTTKIKKSKRKKLWEEIYQTSCNYSLSGVQILKKQIMKTRKLAKNCFSATGTVCLLNTTGEIITINYTSHDKLIDLKRKLSLVTNTNIRDIDLCNEKNEILTGNNFIFQYKFLKLSLLVRGGDKKQCNNVPVLIYFSGGIFPPAYLQLSNGITIEEILAKVGLRYNHCLAISDGNVCDKNWRLSRAVSSSTTAGIVAIRIHSFHSGGGEHSSLNDDDEYDDDDDEQEEEYDDNVSDRDTDNDIGDDDDIGDGDDDDDDTDNGIGGFDDDGDGGDNVDEQNVDVDKNKEYIISYLPMINPFITYTYTPFPS